MFLLLSYVYAADFPIQFRNSPLFIGSMDSTLTVGGIFTNHTFADRDVQAHLGATPSGKIASVRNQSFSDVKFDERIMREEFIVSWDIFEDDVLARNMKVVIAKDAFGISTINKLTQFNPSTNELKELTTTSDMYKYFLVRYLGLVNVDH